MRIKIFRCMKKREKSTATLPKDGRLNTYITAEQVFKTRNLLTLKAFYQLHQTRCLRIHTSTTKCYLTNSKI